MNSVNKVQIAGNLGRDPEIREFQGGNKLARLAVATNEEVFLNGEKKTVTSWHNVTVWGKLAEKAESDLKKGSFVSIDGKLRNNNYTDKEGKKQYVVDIVGTEMSIGRE
jgi:single-strand DNA-binding protein